MAVGIPRVSAVAPLGTFLPGGPIPAKFGQYTQPGKILDPKRILVGSTSNFGEPLADRNQLPGSFLSIDPTGGAVETVGSADAAVSSPEKNTLSGISAARSDAFGRPMRLMGFWASARPLSSILPVNRWLARRTPRSSAASMLAT